MDSRDKTGGWLSRVSCKCLCNPAQEFYPSFPMMLWMCAFNTRRPMACWTRSDGSPATARLLLSPSLSMSTQQAFSSAPQACLTRSSPSPFALAVASAWSPPPRYSHSSLFSQEDFPTTAAQLAPLCGLSPHCASF